MKTPKIYPLKVNFEIPVSSTLKLPRFVYLFVIEGEKLHFIDSGVASAITQIENFLENKNHSFSSIENMFLTHSHPDHIGTAKIIQQKTKCKTYAPENELEWITNTELQFKQRPVPGFFDLVAGPVTVDKILKDGQIIQPEKNITLKVIETSGHSAGSTSFYFEEQKALFCGDAVLLPGELPVFENINDYLKSLEKIKKINPEILFSSWDEPRKTDEIQVLLEKSKNYILSIQNAVIEVSKVFSNPVSLDFCRAVLKTLNQNENIANPLLLRSFLACLQ
jgi:hydroxyacylglutathione hydrolase